MRARSIVALLPLAVLAAAPGRLSAQRRGQDTRPTIAVFPIWNSGSYGQDRENFEALQKGLAAMIISELAANPGARMVEREELQRRLEEQNLGASRRVDDTTAARIGRRVGARYAVTGTFTDFYDDFRVDLHLVNVETGEIIKVEKETMRRDHLFDIIRNVSQRLTKDANVPPLPKQASDARMSRRIPTDALTYYARALLYQDRGEKDKAIEMYTRALEVFPQYGEASEGLQRLKTS
jgi:TolB-like protein